MRAHEIDKSLVAADTQLAIELALKSAREQLKYAGKVNVRWYVTERNLAFDRAAKNIFACGSQSAFVPVKNGTPEIWINATLLPEEAASCVFHESRHLLDVDEVARLEQQAKKNNYPHLGDDWRQTLHRDKRIQSEKDAQAFQQKNAHKSIEIGAAARKE